MTDAFTFALKRFMKSVTAGFSETRKELDDLNKRVAALEAEAEERRTYERERLEYD